MGFRLCLLPKFCSYADWIVTHPGLNKLKGFDVTDFHILLTTVNGRNMNGTVYIPNPSVMTLSMVCPTIHVMSLSGLECAC